MKKSFAALLILGSVVLPGSMTYISSSALASESIDIESAAFQSAACLSAANDLDAEMIDAILTGSIQELGTDFILDLDGDGSQEEVHLIAHHTEEWDNSWIPDDFMIEYSVLVNNAQYNDRGIAVYGTLYGVSFDGKTIQLISEDYGPSEDPVCTFYRFQDGEIVKSGEIGDWKDSLIVDGNNIYANESCRVIETALKKTLYICDETGILYQTAQDYYEYVRYSDQPVQLLQPVTLYMGMGLEYDSFTMNPQEIEISYTDGENWIFLTGVDHEGGWMYVGDLSSLDVPLYFEGLVFAD